MRFLIISIAGLLVLVSCRKDPKQSFEYKYQELAIPHKLPSDSGTYWVYETFVIDSIGNESTTGDIDTTWVMGDSLDNGNTYVVYKGFSYVPWQLTLLRDSSGYIVYNSGNILYHTYPNDDTIKYYQGTGNFSSWLYRMNGPLVQKNVPYGSFDCFEHKMIKFYENGDPVNVCGDLEYVSRSYYHPYLGRIAQQFAYITEQESWCQYRERRLIDYYHP